jgi:LPPG:FO 2-phospho-L-lactate transferase
MKSVKVVFLSGGTGTPKLIQNTTELLDPKEITIIGNTGDDWEFYGLYVSPDIDSILLTLSGLIDFEKWWGISDDSFNMIKFLSDYMKEEIWFNLGDMDTGLCLYRTFLRKKGLNLTKITDIIRRSLNIEAEILPMANQSVRTMIETPNKVMHLQEFWVKHKGEPAVKDIFFEGDLTQTTPNVLHKIEEAEYIIIGPSNPVSSIGPMLAIEPLRHALRQANGKKIAISPLIGSEAISGPTTKFLSAWDYEISPTTIAKMYSDFLDGLVLHNSDQSYFKAIQKHDILPIFENIYIKNQIDANRLLKTILEKF